jgi:hypothetical protein
MGRIMWSQAESLYRGQSLTGTVITVDEDALKTALRNAGNSIFDTEWWIETMTIVLERWGLKAKQWTDPATQVLRVHFRSAMANGTEPGQPTGTTTGPLTTRLLNSGKLNSGGLNSGNLNSGGLNSGKLGEKK